MSSKIIDGKKLGAKLCEDVAKDVEALKSRGITPGLAVVLVGEDSASQIYVKNKRFACRKAGIISFSHDLPEASSEKEILSLIHRLNSDAAVHGILVQLPLPDHVDEGRILEAIEPGKDVDGFHPENVGLLMLDTPRFIPCTPAGIVALIESTGIDIKGKRAAVVGRSRIVGKPVALLLLARHATVTICHSRTEDLQGIIKEADIVVAAVGRPEMVKGSWIKAGACVIDVGINRTEDGRLVGDCEFESVSKTAGFITPVPGGVGPMTIAMLLKNTVEAARRTLALV